MKNLKISSGIMNVLDRIDTVVMDSLAGTISTPSDFTQHFDSSIDKVPQSVYPSSIIQEECEKIMHSMDGTYRKPPGKVAASVYPSEEVQKQLEKYLFEG